MAPSQLSPARRCQTVRNHRSPAAPAGRSRRPEPARWLCGRGQSCWVAPAASAIQARHAAGRVKATHQCAKAMLPLLGAQAAYHGVKRRVTQRCEQEHRHHRQHLCRPTEPARPAGAQLGPGGPGAGVVQGVLAGGQCRERQDSRRRHAAGYQGQGAAPRQGRQVPAPIRAQMALELALWRAGADQQRGHAEMRRGPTPAGRQRRQHH